MRIGFLLVTTLLSLASCGIDSGDAASNVSSVRGVSACELCGRQHHEGLDGVPITQDAKSSHAPKEVDSGDIMAFVEKRNVGPGQVSSFVCPGIFGGLPAAGSLRVHAPAQIKKSSRAVSWIWFLTSANPIDVVVGPGASLIVFANERAELGSSGGEYIWRITVEAKKSIGEFADLCSIEVETKNLHGGGGSVLIHVPNGSDNGLDDLFVPNTAMMALRLGGDAILSSVDGTCVRLSFRRGREPLVSNQQGAANEWMLERIYSGEPGTLKWLEGNSTMSQPGRVAIKNKSAASRRAVAFLSRESQFAELKPIRVTKTNLGHYRVEFSPSASGTSTFVVVNAKDGRVGFSRHPRQCLNVGR